MTRGHFITEGKEVIGVDTLGGLKSVYILGHPIKNELPEGLEMSGMDLQKLFIKLTNEREAEV